MNVYDFDETIYDGDSSIDFYKYNLKKDKRLMKLWPKQIKAYLDYTRNKITKTEMKTIFYEYFIHLDNLPQRIDAFWKDHEHKIKSWYLSQKREDDVIVSASPDFVLKPICDRLNIHLIASEVNPKTGEHLSENCYGHEKVKRFKALYNLEDIESFYSDSYSDDPLAQFAKKSYLVKKNTIKDW